MNRSIIVEGPDGMGKTVLSEQLARHFGYSHKTCGPAPVRPVDLLYWINKQEKQVRAGRNVLDRLSCISSRVYGNLSDQVNYVSVQAYMDQALRMQVLNGPIFVLCLASEVHHAPADYDTLEGLEEIANRSDDLIESYQDVFASAGIDPIIYDWMKPHAFSQLCTKIEEIAACLDLAS